VSVGVGTDSCT